VRDRDGRCLEEAIEGAFAFVDALAARFVLVPCPVDRLTHAFADL